MRWTSKIAAAALAALLQGCVTAPVSAPAPIAVEARAPVTILVSLDGFRPDYVTAERTPNLAAAAAGGVFAAMKPSFPTMTFPNHYTLVTGCGPTGMASSTIISRIRPNPTSASS
jgi:predicted AlkP superfamily pyrophosphatase or phosphodiesterase